MNSSATLVEKISCVQEPMQKVDKNLLQKGERNLSGACVVYDKDVRSYNALPKSGQRGYFGNAPLESERLTMPRRRITCFQNPDAILLLVPDGFFSAATKAELLTVEGYKQRHQEFLEHISRYGFIREDNKCVSVFQELVDRECKLYEEIISHYT